MGLLSVVCNLPINCSVKWCWSMQKISLLCVIVKLLMGFNCERWTDDMGDLRNIFFHYPSGSLQSHNQCVVLFPTSIAHLSTASENTIPTATTTTTTVNNIPSVW
ncbi:conserved hypothetical protein [Trichinella spiralis]|uniref:hypothetical protein n=1 Tax=Trichinella spiralis TaxID=6334 RepID=UPI0001EFBDAE|nr:conserved hypothetical protein [Trichinella spiralis]